MPLSIIAPQNMLYLHHTEHRGKGRIPEGGIRYSIEAGLFFGSVCFYIFAIMCLQVISAYGGLLLAASHIRIFHYLTWE
jgi:hypothetical protein